MVRAAGRRAKERSRRLERRADMIDSDLVVKCENTIEVIKALLVGNPGGGITHTW